MPKTAFWRTNGGCLKTTRRMTADKKKAPTRKGDGAFKSPKKWEEHEIGVWRQSAPEGLAQFGMALRFADTGIGQQAGIQAGKLAAADNAALP